MASYCGFIKFRNQLYICVCVCVCVDVLACIAILQVAIHVFVIQESLLFVPKQPLRSEKK